MNSSPPVEFLPKHRVAVESLAESVERLKEDSALEVATIDDTPDFIYLETPRENLEPLWLQQWVIPEDGKRLDPANIVDKALVDKALADADKDAFLIESPRTAKSLVGYVL